MYPAFLPPCATHFDGCENAARSPNCSAFGKNRGTFGIKHRNFVSSASHTDPEANHKSVSVTLSYQIAAHIFYKLFVAFFMTYTVDVQARHQNILGAFQGQ